MDPSARIGAARKKSHTTNDRGMWKECAYAPAGAASVLGPSTSEPLAVLI